MATEFFYFGEGGGCERGVGAYIHYISPKKVIKLKSIIIIIIES